MTPTDTPPETTNGHIPHALPVTPAIAGDAEERDIPIDETGPAPDQPRKYFDPERDEEMQAGLQEFGQINAILVYLSQEPPNYRIIAGERRWRAAKALGWKTIRARVLKEVPDDARRRLLMIVDNEQRVDLSAIERGLIYRDYMTRYGLTATAFSRQIGKSIAAITRDVKLAQCLTPPALMDRVQAGTLPPSIAQELRSLPDDDARLAIASQYPQPLKSRAEVIAAIKSVKNGHSISATSGFNCEEGGIKFAISWASGTADAQALTQVENALRIVLKDLAAQKHRGVAHWRNFLQKKAQASKKAAALAEAQRDLANVANPTPERSTPNA
jgi:ParB/RepB/Spo0J family partition protein